MQLSVYQLFRHRYYDTADIIPCDLVGKTVYFFQLEANLAAWNATIKSLRDSQKLEELEMTFNDGTKRKIWMVNRPKPEAIETVDFVSFTHILSFTNSLLPSRMFNDEHLLIGN